MAIAFDAASTGYDSNGTSGTSTQDSITVGSTANTVMIVSFNTYVNGEASPSCSYSGTSDSITRIDANVNDASAGDSYLFLIVNPQSGAQTVTVTSDSRAYRRMACVTYSGVNQSSTPDAHTNWRDAVATTSCAHSITSVASNCWIVMCAINGNGLETTAGTSTTVRKEWGASANFASINDSNGTVSAGSNTLTVTSASNTNWGGTMISLAPAVAAGPTNLKTYNTNTKANIKTLNTNTIANTKTVNTIS